MEDAAVVVGVGGVRVGVEEGTSAGGDADTISLLRRHLGDQGGLLALFDGHAGRVAADAAASHVVPILAKLLQEVGEEEGEGGAGLDAVPLSATPCPLHALGSRWMLGLQEQLEADESVPGHAGATAVVVAVSAGGRVVVANAGDARALAVHATADGGADGASAVRLTYDHVASDEAEAERIRAAGGFVKDGRVNGQLAVTRCLGDALVKRYVVADPYVHVGALSGDVTHLIVACDGVFDVFTDDEVATFVGSALADAAARAESVSYPALADALLAAALDRGTTDNLSLLILPAQT
jgi:serine/threonine protein phosphatase PrpC